jgi:hypothetical protein
MNYNSIAFKYVQVAKLLKISLVTSNLWILISCKNHTYDLHSLYNKEHVLRSKSITSLKLHESKM